MTNRTLAPVLLQALVLGRATLLTHGMERDSAVARRTAETFWSSRTTAISVCNIIRIGPTVMPFLGYRGSTGVAEI